MLPKEEALPEPAQKTARAAGGLKELGKQSHRAVQRLPPEAQTGIAVTLQLLTLAAAVVTVELEATLIIALHEHHAIGRAPFRRGCSYAHCIGL